MFVRQLQKAARRLAPSTALRVAALRQVTPSFCRCQPVRPFSAHTVAQRSLGSESAQYPLETALVRANLTRLVQVYRDQGHLRADLDPLGLQTPSKNVADIDHARASVMDVVEPVPVEGVLNLSEESATVQQIVDRLESIYCGKIGYEFAHLEQTEREWFAEQVEAGVMAAPLTPAEKRNIHTLLTMSETFDHFMQKKFATFKRYALEGNESMMPAVDTIFSRAAQHNVDNVVLGMPHRGRLNLLVGLLDYPARNLFRKIKGFSDIPSDVPGLCDVVSHIACSTDKRFSAATKPIHVSLLHNPSHLEAVNPVSLGKTRAKQEDSGAPSKTLCVQLHGDAAFSGQGVVHETLMMANLPNFTVGGTVHLVVNNQLGFTTTPVDGRSMRYCSDACKAIGMPIIHVNSDSPEDVVKACRLAVDYQAKFHKDVLIDMIGYRRHGHNEVDEPSFTQPRMYKQVRQQKSSPSKYAAQLKEEGLTTDESIAKLTARFDSFLEAELQAMPNVTITKEEVTSESFKGNRSLTGKWTGMVFSNEGVEPVSTGVDPEELKQIAIASVQIPPNFEPHQRLLRTHIQARVKSVSDDQIDWATAEAMAWGSLLKQGYNIRLSGQDVERGTFSQRHALLVDQRTEADYVPLQQLSQNQGRFSVGNSHLSEFGVVGFEYGYSLENPKTLAIWEAQFGDFNNTAQVIIDQFMSGGESKWMRQSGMVMMLPHGFDGAGPEHSSSRMERFLQLIDTPALDREYKGPFPTAQQLNMSIVNPSTPANYFHVMRRQMLRNFRKPLVVVAPKTLLRHAMAVSPVKDMQPGTSFLPVIGDRTVNPEQVRRVVFCSGKIYYDLVKEREASKHHDTALIRIEELAPFPGDAVSQELSRYSRAEKVIWLQEEPLNAGAFLYLEPQFHRLVSSKFGGIHYVGRPSIALPATGTVVQHQAEHVSVVKGCFSA
eukprot:GILJ01003330.1.p1 GENE.GILJ01003330.1~~GILJ01003330.1.p1  ORF type:complete len:942 (+),score=147.78 GILJ01003330.1:40-2865(+)